MKKEWRKKVVIAGVSVAVCFTFSGCAEQENSDRGSRAGDRGAVLCADPKDNEFFVYN